MRQVIIYPGEDGYFVAEVPSLPEDAFTKDAFLNALDFVCSKSDDIDSMHDLAPDIDKTLYERWRKANPLPNGQKETIAYDMTTLLFFGVSCPFAELGYNPDRNHLSEVAERAISMPKRTFSSFMERCAPRSFIKIESEA